MSIDCHRSPSRGRQYRAFDLPTDDASCMRSCALLFVNLQLATASDWGRPGVFEFCKLQAFCSSANCSARASGRGCCWPLASGRAWLPGPWNTVTPKITACPLQRAVNHVTIQSHLFSTLQTAFRSGVRLRARSVHDLIVAPKHPVWRV